MATSPAVLLVDDGELDDVRRVLQELGADFAHLRGGAVPAKIAPPGLLFVTTSRRAMIAQGWPARAPYKIGVVSDDSNTLRAMLKRMGFDLLIRRPVHAYALRLVLLRALYDGEEKRREERVPFGIEISYRSGFRRKTATLADLSLRGCRLLSEHPLRPDATLTIFLPKDVTGTPMSLRGRVARGSEEREVSGRYLCALRFDPKKNEVDRALQAALQARRSGSVPLGGNEVAIAHASTADAPAAAPPTAAPPARAPAAEAPKAAPATPENRRKHDRAAYAQEIVTLGDEASSVLLGRDISMGGMRVAANPRLELGDSFRLAIYGGPREDPFIVRALVVHRAETGVGLRFEGVRPEIAQRLEALVARLPSVESLEDGEASAIGSVVSRILAGERE